MQELQKQFGELQHAVKTAVAKLNLADAKKQLQALETQSQAPNFWADAAGAQVVMKHQAQLEAKIRPWQELQRAIDEAVELSALNDTSLQADLRAQLNNLQADFNQLQKQLQFSGPYDDHAAIVSVHAGAGGTDAQDWAQMLERMYVRWTESGKRGSTQPVDEASGARSPDDSKYGSQRSSAASSAAFDHASQKYTVELLEETPGEEAGIKSATLAISGPFAYGKLKAEHGVHRLVRLSPFNADHKRQTSFAKVEVMPKIDQPSELQIDEKDLQIDVYRSGGHGGQSVNTTDSAVRVTHLPTGFTVAIQNERSQLQNKETALTILRSRLAQLQLEQHKEQLAELKGPSQSAEWGNQIRSYVLHPYKQVKDLRTGYQSSDPDAVLAGDLDGFITAYLEYNVQD